ncbi:MAG TPA: ABC transporter substrate-binding protein [Longimicrobium sp.]|jgi:peptide/nickel transport system substrate-binding protein|nr:ABC transporter substrate-binding protein [Longimicrobium sp.]
MRTATRGPARLRSAAVPALLALAAACGDRRPPEHAARPDSAGGTPENGGTAVVVEIGDMEMPSPLVAQAALDGDLYDVMYMGLTRGAWRNGRPVSLTSNDSPMALAYHWEYVGPDSSAIRYRMRTGVRWSDGQPIDARDVVFTYAMFADSQVASPRQDDVAQIDSVRAENDSTVVFYFKRRYAEMLFASGIPIVPRHVYEPAGPGGIRGHVTLTDPVGHVVVSGPFTIGGWKRGESITLVPNPTFSPKPHLDRVVIRVVPEAVTRVVEVRNGAADFVRGIAFDQVPQLLGPGSGLHVEREQKRFWEYVAYLPSAHPAFADPQVRRALGMAIDVPGIIRALRMEDFTQPAAGPYSPIFRDLYDSTRMKPFPFDSAGAKRILDARGWRDADGDGVREKDGRPLRFTLLTNSGNARRADVTQIVQQQWKRIGVDASLRQIETNVFIGAITGRKYQAALGSWQVPLSADITPFWAPQSPFNIVAYDNPQAWGLMQQALAQPTAEQASPLWRAAAERIVQDQPYTWLYYYDQVTVVRDRLRGVRVDSYGAYQNLWEWWIPRGLQGGTGSAGGASPSAPAAGARDTSHGKR